MKNNLVFVSLIISIYFISCGRDPQNILDSAYIKCQSIQNGYYEMKRSINMNHEKDTSEYIYKCYFKKLINDSLFPVSFHYNYYISDQHEGEVIYTGDDLVKVSQKDSSALILSKQLWGKVINEEKYNYILYSPFTSLKSSPLPYDLKMNNEKYIVNYIGEEKFNNIACYRIRVNEITNDDSLSAMKTIKVEYEYWISKTDSIPIRYTLYAEGVMRGDTTFQYVNTELIKYDLNNINDEYILTLSSIPENYKIKNYSPNNFSKSALTIGEVAPNWNLTSLKDEKIELKDLKGKLVLIDFFHKGCKPCIQAMPTIQSLHDKYSNRGLRIIGINPIDKNKTMLISFLSNLGITYPILTDEDEVSNKYGVTGFPTIFLIDKTGKIIYTQLGFSKDLENVLDALILKNI